MRKSKKPLTETLIGYLEASRWDDDDNVTGVKIVTDDEDYMVEMKGLGKGLLEFLDEEVEVSGTVTEEKDGTLWIKIDDYELLDEIHEEDFDEEFDFEDMDIDEGDEKYIH